MKRTGFISLIIILFLQVSAANAQVVKSGDYLSSIEEAQKLIDKWRVGQRIPGVQIAIIINGELIWSDGFGLANVENNIPLTPRTKMRIGSVSKTFTSAALGRLMEAGSLEIDLPVQKYIPYFPNKRYPVTTRLLAGHLAGIRHYRGDEFLINRYYPTVREGISIFENDTLIARPGEQYNYSSYGYNLISAVVEGASGVDFLTYMQQNVFDQLEMSETTADYNEKIIPYRTSYYALKDTTLINAPYVDNSYKWAGGGFLSTCEDIVTFGNAFLSDSFLKETTINELWESQKTTGGKLTNYGIGWVNGDHDDNGSWVGHSGGSVGGITQFVVYPEQKLVLAMMVNSSNAAFEDLHHQVAGLFFTDNAE